MDSKIILEHIAELYLIEKQKLKEAQENPKDGADSIFCTIRVLLLEELLNEFCFDYEKEELLKRVEKELKGAGKD